MKSVITVLSLISILSLSGFSYAQQISTNEYNNTKGEFHFGLNDFAHLEDWGTRFTISPRIGYSITEMDMIYVDFTLSIFNNSRNEGFNLESSLVYRRYLKNGQFKPFMQFGVGAGYMDYEPYQYDAREFRNYMKAETGIGVSYRYKRWTFEVGMKGDYNRFGNGRVQFAPMVGVSFSF